MACSRLLPSVRFNSPRFPTRASNYLDLLQRIFDRRLHLAHPALRLLPAVADGLSSGASIATDGDGDGEAEVSCFPSHAVVPSAIPCVDMTAECGVGTVSTDAAPPPSAQVYTVLVGIRVGFAGVVEMIRSVDVVVVGAECGLGAAVVVPAVLRSRDGVACLGEVVWSVGVAGI